MIRDGDACRPKFVRQLLTPASAWRSISNRGRAEKGIPDSFGFRAQLVVPILPMKGRFDEFAPRTFTDPVA